MFNIRACYSCLLVDATVSLIFLGVYTFINIHLKFISLQIILPLLPVA